MPAPIHAYLEIRTAAPSGFSPDGGTVLISSNLTGTAQLYRTPAGGGALRQLTDLPEPVGGGYLPTEERLLVATDDGGNERYQLYLMDDAPPVPPTRATDLAPLVVDPDAIHSPGGVSRDGRLLAYATNRRNGADFDVFVRDLGSGDEACVYAEGGWAGAAGFSPDGRYLAISRLTERPGDNEVHLLDRSTGERWEVAPHDDPSSVGGPSWLPDSRTFYFATDAGRDTGVVARYDVATRSYEEVLDFGWGVGCAVDWTGRHLAVVRNVDGRTEGELRDPHTLEVTAPLPLDELPGRGVVGGVRFSRDGRQLAFSYSSASVPGDAWRYDPDTGELVRLTTSPCDLDPATFVEPELIRYASFDGLEVPAYVYRPPSSGGSRLPVVVVIHGGPESQYRPSFAPLTQYLVAHGFVVVAPNVRGSTGYGKRYQHLDDVELRLDSVADLGSLHDWIAATDDLDPDRCALYGGSYGGYMVLAGLTFQPERWAAGVGIVGISSLVTFLENTAPYRRRFREREYGSLTDDREFLEAASPLTHIDRLEAPLCLIHGANDPRVPVGEARQIHDVLQRKGVRCDLLVYEDEGHGLAKLANRLDAYPRVAQFLHEVLGA